jgi:endonuclease-3
MTKAERYKHVLEYFQDAIPDAQTELAYRNPYELLVAVILSAQCTDKRVNMVTPALFDTFPDAMALAAASPETVLSFVKSISYPNSKAGYLVKMARLLVAEHGGEVPSDFEALTSLPGVGRKTANVLLSVVYHKPTMAVDTHVFRVSKRLGLVSDSATKPLQVELELTRNIPKVLMNSAHHWLILHGRYVCLARTPKCQECPLTEWCVYFSKLQAPDTQSKKKGN